MDYMDYKDFTPIRDYVVLEVEPDPEVSKGGIFLPKVSEEVLSRWRVGLVKAVGPGSLVNGQRQPVEFQVGDRVLFNMHHVDTKTLKVLSENPLVVVTLEENCVATVEEATA